LLPDRKLTILHAFPADTIEFEMRKSQFANDLYISLAYFDSKLSTAGPALAWNDWQALHP